MFAQELQTVDHEGRPPECSWMPDEPHHTVLQSDVRFFRSLIVGLITAEVLALIAVLLWG